jgi:cell division septum initiation protein DivIVA
MFSIVKYEATFSFTVHLSPQNTLKSEHYTKWWMKQLKSMKQESWDEEQAFLWYEDDRVEEIRAQKYEEAKRKVKAEFDAKTKKLPDYLKTQMKSQVGRFDSNLAWDDWIPSVAWNKN